MINDIVIVKGVVVPGLFELQDQNIEHKKEVKRNGNTVYLTILIDIARAKQEKGFKSSLGRLGH